MSTVEYLREFIEELEKRLKTKMPQIRDEIRTYEEHLKNGYLVKNPSPGPQFNG